MTRWLHSKLFIPSICLLLGVALLLSVSCESTTTNTHIAVEPSSVELTKKGDVVSFTATYSPGDESTSNTLYMPLVWTVSNPDLGQISATGGRGAVYECYGIVGDNAITVKDQGSAEGVAIVNCSANTQIGNLTIEPATAEILWKGGVVTFTVVQKEEVDIHMPLVWSVDHPNLGRITESGGFSAVYEGYGGKGYNTITVRDQSGASGVAVVSTP